MPKQIKKSIDVYLVRKFSHKHNKYYYAIVDEKNRFLVLDIRSILNYFTPKDLYDLVLNNDNDSKQ